MLALVAAFTISFAFAGPPTSKAPARPAASAARPAPPPPPRESAIVHIATEVAQGLGKVPAGALVAVSPLTSDIGAPKADELALRVATQIAGRLGSSPVHPQPVTLAVARGVSGHAASLVYVQLEIVKGELRATADLYPVVANSWDRLRNPLVGPQAHVFAGAPIDAEVRTFLQPIVLEQARVHKVKHEESDVLALGCGDIDADGGAELVLATRTRVVVGKLQGDKLAIVRATPWSQLASRAPVPLREPTASVVVAGGHRGEIFVGVTDRGAVAIDGSLAPRRQLAGLPIPGTNGEACVVPTPELGAFEGSGVACEPTRGDEAVLAMPAARFDAAAALDLVVKDGALAQVVAAREPGGKLRLRRIDASGKAIEAPIDGVGAQLALADLDLDGVPEVAFTSDLPDSDVLTIASWRSGGIAPRLRIPTKDAIAAIAACPPEEKGLPGLVAVVGSEVWLVR
jgi:hypothetical protein